MGRSAPAMVLVGMLAGVLGACSFGGQGTQVQPGDPDAPAGDTIDAPLPGQPDAYPDPIDAEPSVACPGNYVLARGASRYVISSSKKTWLDAEHDCEDDSGGMWTHLIALDDDGEWGDAVGTAVATHGGEWVHIGVVRDSGSPSGPWRIVTGGNAPVLHWRQTLITDEPNNGGNGEPAVVFDPGWDLLKDPDIGGFIDVDPGFTAYYFCECDGRPPVNATY